MQSLPLSPPLLLAWLAGALIGAAAILAWHQRRIKQPRPAPDGLPDPRPASPRQEAQRYFLMNETGNVLISTSLSPADRLPEDTLALFSAALAHLSAIFFAIVGSRDPETGESFSLYNYAVLKRALAAHPVFIRVGSAVTAPTSTPIRTAGSISFALQAGATAPPESSYQAPPEWLQARVAGTCAALGMDDGARHAGTLRSIHSQMRAEAERLRSRQFRTLRTGVGLDLLRPAAHGAARELPAETVDDLEVGHVTLYCECLLGVSLVSVKLAHAHYHDYLRAGSTDMEHDTYLFVSPSQLRSALKDVENLPRASMPH